MAVGFISGLWLSFYFLLLSSSSCPEVRDRSVLLHEVDVSRRREENLIRVGNADDTLRRIRVWSTLLLKSDVCS